MWVEPFEKSLGGIPVFEVWEKKGKCQRFHLAYGEDVAKIWVRMREMVERYEKV